MSERPYSSRGGPRPYREIVERYASEPPEPPLPEGYTQDRHTGIPLKQQPDRYVIERIAGRVICRAVFQGGREETVRHRVHHSPTGFEFGYGGSGPSDLARSIMWHWLDTQPNPAVYQDFKRRFLDRSEGNEILIAGWQIRRFERDWLDRHPLATLED